MSERTEKPYMTVAKTIRQQITNNAFMCWGSRNFIAGQGKEDLGYLTWTVQNNPKLKGKYFVTVKLNGKDLYDLTVWRRSKDLNVKIYKEVNDLFFDQLEDTIFDILG